MSRERPRRRAGSPPAKRPSRPTKARRARRALPYELAISCTEYEGGLERSLAERLRARIAGAFAPLSAEADAAGDAAHRLEQSRIVVVLHDRQWGRTPATASAPVALARRIAREGVDFLRVVRLDDSALADTLEEAPSRELDIGLEALEDWVIAALEAEGGEARPRPAPDESEMEAHARRADRRETFLGSARASLVCAREFDRLADDVARRAAALDDDGIAAEVRRMPGRCIVQLGPLALTLSWVRARGDTVADGRLLVVHWEGRVGPRGEHTPERAQAARAHPAVALHEAVLAVDAVDESDWRWCREGASFGGFATSDLAALCVDSLASTLQERQARSTN